MFADALRTPYNRTVRSREKSHIANKLQLKRIVRITTAIPPFLLPSFLPASLSIPSFSSSLSCPLILLLLRLRLGKLRNKGQTPYTSYNNRSKQRLAEAARQNVKRVAGRDARVEDVRPGRQRPASTRAL
jgi:hypothetical protein